MPIRTKQILIDENLDVGSKSLLNVAGLTDVNGALVPATATGIGGVKIGANISIGTDGTISVAAGGAPLAPATATTLGGVMVPLNGNIVVDASGNLALSTTLTNDLPILVTGGDAKMLHSHSNYLAIATAASTYLTQSSAATSLTTQSINTTSVNINGAKNYSILVSSTGSLVFSGLNSVSGYMFTNGGIDMGGNSIADIGGLSIHNGLLSSQTVNYTTGIVRSCVDSWDVSIGSGTYGYFRGRGFAVNNGLFQGALTVSSYADGFAVADMNQNLCNFYAGTYYAHNNVTVQWTDVAELVPATGNSTLPDNEKLMAGDVAIIDPGNSESVVLSTGVQYDMTVAGVVSTKPGFILGDLTLSMSPEALAALVNSSVPMALAGRVPTNVTTKYKKPDGTFANRPIRKGYILVSSSVPGHAMAADPSDFGSVIPFGTMLGKAMGDFNPQPSATMATVSTGVSIDALSGSVTSGNYTLNVATDPANALNVIFTWNGVAAASTPWAAAAVLSINGGAAGLLSFTMGSTVPTLPASDVVTATAAVTEGSIKVWVNLG